MVRHAPGAFCWSELVTSDRAAAKTFYTSLFGWKAVDIPLGDGQVYSMAHAGKKLLGGLYQLAERDHRMGISPHWLPYVSVASANRTAKKAQGLGASVLAPFDVMTLGRMAIIQDPQGARFAVWQAKKHGGAQITCWNELITTDTKAAAAFYAKLFPWKLKPSKAGDDYMEFWLGRRAQGGLMARTPEMGDAPPHWMTYFAVADCKRTTAKAEKLGATIHVRPRPIPGVGMFSVIADPQGASFAIIKLKATR